MALRLPVRLQLLIPAVENAVGPEAFRPGRGARHARRHQRGDRQHRRRGPAGPVRCADLRREAKPDLLLDFATLTGAARIALGPDLPALFANDDALAADYLAAGARPATRCGGCRCGARTSLLLASQIADIANAGSSRMAGSVTAALYLERFVPEGQRWAHPTSTPGTTARDRAARPAARRRACAPPTRCSRRATRNA
jgi:leucyl aminopeptidase